MKYKNIKYGKGKVQQTMLDVFKNKRRKGLWNKRVKTKEYWVKAEIPRNLTKI